MYIDQIHGTNFQQKTRFVPETVRSDIAYILNSMCKEPVISKNKKTYFLKSLSLKDGSTIYDNRINLEKPVKVALFDVGKKAQLVIDITTGEIIDSYKTFFSTWRGIFKSLEKSAKKISENYNNENLVKRTYLPYNKI